MRGEKKNGGLSKTKKIIEMHRYRYVHLRKVSFSKEGVKQEGGSGRGEEKRRRKRLTCK